MNIDKVVNHIIKMGHHVAPTTLRKGSESLIAISIGDKVLRPTFCIRELYELEDNHNLSDFEIAKWVVDKYLETLQHENDFKEILDFNTMKEHFRLGLRKIGYPDGVISMPFLDLELYIFIDLPDKCVPVTKSLIVYWETCVEDVFNIAKDKSRETVDIKGIMEVVTEIVDGIVVSKCIKNNETDKIYVGRTNSGIKGASIMYYLDELLKFANDINDDLFIIAHTIDEIFIIPCSTMDDYECEDFFQSMIEILPKQDNLATHVYKLIRSENRIMY